MPAAGAAPPVLQARMFAYSDAARYRLGTNYQMLPTNHAKAPVYCPFQRDGLMNFGTNYADDPNYVGSTLKPTTFKKPSVAPTFTNHEEWAGRVTSFVSDVGPDDFEQAAALWGVLGRNPGEQDRFVGNLSSHVAGVKSDKIRDMVYGRWPRHPDRENTVANEGRHVCQG